MAAPDARPPTTAIPSAVVSGVWRAVMRKYRKGVRTKDYIIKRKLMLWLHGIRVQEV